MNVQYRDITYNTNHWPDLEVICSDIQEQEAQREAIAKRWLVWSPVDEPQPPSRPQRMWDLCPDCEKWATDCKCHLL